MGREVILYCVYLYRQNVVDVLLSAFVVYIRPIAALPLEVTRPTSRSWL